MITFNGKIKNLLAVVGILAFFPAVITNSLGYANIKRSLREYKSIEIALQFHGKEIILNDYTSKFLHKIYFEVGENIAYDEFRELNNNN